MSNFVEKRMHNGAYLTPNKAQTTQKNKYLAAIKKRENKVIVIIKIQFYFAANIEHSHKFHRILFCIYDFFVCLFRHLLLCFPSGFLVFYER